jgi:pSer/pThr/pTyr-binding forkhead associated (FHA) protein/biotin carboxyl carrier protein
VSSDLRATLTVETGQHAGKTVVLDGHPVGIGRSSKCALSLKGAPGVSRDHALVMVRDGVWMVTDAGSRNGTLLNGTEVQGSMALNDGDVIGISEERVRFSWPARARSGVPRDVPMPAMSMPNSRSTPPSPGASSMTPTLPPTSQPGFGSSSVPQNASQKTREAPRTTRTIRESSSVQAAAPASPYVPTVPFVAMEQSLPETVPPPSTISGEGPTAAHVAAPATATASSPPSKHVSTMPRSLPPRKKSSFLTFVLGGFAGLLLAAIGGLTFDHFKDGGTRRAMAQKWAFEQFTTLKARYLDGADADTPALAVDAGPLDDALTRSTATGPAPVGAAASAAKDAGVVDATKNAAAADAAASDAAASDAGVVDAAAAAAKGDAQKPIKVPIKAPLTGRIAELRVKPGDKVTVDTTVAFIESGPAKFMKKLVPLDKKAQGLRASAARGKKSAVKELKNVERDIAKLSKKLKKTPVKAGTTGTVETVHVDVGTHLKGRDALVTVSSTPAPAR